MSTRLGLVLALAGLVPVGSPAEDFASKPNPWARPTPSQRLEQFAERRRFEARVDMLDTARDAERSLAERRLRHDGSAAELASYRRRVVREDDADDRRLRAELRSPSTDWWRSLGPATRRVFLQSGLDLRRITREADRETRLEALGREIERRDARSEWLPPPPPP